MSDLLTPMRRFGAFELDVQAGELRKHGTTLKLRGQPIEILGLLLDRPGQVVTRDELRHLLWPADTYVDFEHGLNSAVKRLRAALCDSAEKPRYIETIARRGYRYIGPANSTSPIQFPTQPLAVDGTLALDAVPKVVPAEIAPWPAAPERRARWVAPVAALVLLLGFVAGLIYSRFPAAAPRISRVTKLTNSHRVDVNPRILTDGARLFFQEREAGRWRLLQTSVAGGIVQPFPEPFPGTRLIGSSPDRSEFLLTNVPATTGEEGPLWVMPVQGGIPHRLGEIMAVDAAWWPDGSGIVYVQGTELYRAARDGSNPRRWITVPGHAGWFSWSPDGKRLRFTLTTEPVWSRTIWEVSADGSDLHPVLQGWSTPQNECCGTWTADGRYYIFHAQRNGSDGLWAMREPKGLFQHAESQPIALTAGPFAHMAAPNLSPDGRRAYVVAATSAMELRRYNASTRELESVLPGLDIRDLDISPDGKQAVFVPESDGLWRVNLDGSGRVQLVEATLLADRPRWSPDGNWIVFETSGVGERSRRIAMIPSAGGARRDLSDGSYIDDEPDWSPDAKTIIVRRRGKDGLSALHVIDLGTKRSSKLPDSDNLSLPRWSSASRYVSAIDENGRGLRVFDFQTGKWTLVAQANLIGWTAWSRTGAHLYYQDTREEGQPIYRLRYPAGPREKVLVLPPALRNGVTRAVFTTLMPDGSPLLTLLRSGGDIYALDLDLP